MGPLRRYSVPAYIRKDGIVYLKGLFKNGTMGATVFTLPAGYRPSESKIMLGRSITVTGAASAGTAHTHPVTYVGCAVGVDPTTGAVTFGPSGSNSQVSMDGICFPAEA